MQNNGALDFYTVNRKQSDNGGCRLRDSCCPLGSHARPNKSFIFRPDRTFSFSFSSFFFCGLFRQKRTHSMFEGAIRSWRTSPHLPECVGPFFLIVIIYCFINSFVSVYCRGCCARWSILKKKVRRQRLTSPCQVCDVISTGCSIWQRCGRLKVLPMALPGPLKMHRVPY